MSDYGIYQHSVIVHERNFVSYAENDEDPDIHTQSIENLWMRKKKVQEAKWYDAGLFLSYLYEFSWFQKNINNTFGNFIVLIQRNYPIE